MGRRGPSGAVALALVLRQTQALASRGSRPETGELLEDRDGGSPRRRTAPPSGHCSRPEVSKCVNPGTDMGTDETDTRMYREPSCFIHAPWQI